MTDIATDGPKWEFSSDPPKDLPKQATNEQPEDDEGAQETEHGYGFGV